MKHIFTLLAALAAGAVSLPAQSAAAGAAPAAPDALPAAIAPAAVTPASITLAAVTLPDAPGFSTSLAPAPVDGGQTGNVPTTARRGELAGKYSTLIPAGVSAQPLSAGNKVVLGFADAFSPFSLVGITFSAGYSHLVDSAPHYGTNSQAFGKRVGAAALRSTSQAILTDSLFAPIFHDDPRYYELGRQHRFVNRVVYAATRVVVTRTDSGHGTLNAPLLLGYAGTSALVNNTIYPDRDSGFKETAKGFAGSLGGAVIGFEVNEFLNDALRIVHLRRN